MPTVSGRLLFDRERTNSATGLAGIANVSIVLRNTVTGAMLAVLTDANGNYSFTNVPNGSYELVESYGTPAVPTPGNFANATVGPPAISVSPPISFAPNPPPGATNLDSINRSAFPVTVSGSNLTQNFLNGPVTYTPITNILDSNAIIEPENLIVLADTGTFGSFLPGTNANTGASPNPYPDIGSEFVYVLPNSAVVTPNDGEYTIQNIMNNARSNVAGAWWRIADHTTGNETGRMMVINGANPGAIFFQEMVTVKPNTNYLLSSWILNLAKRADLANPQLGIRVLDANGDVLFSETLTQLIPTNLNNPEWIQLGEIINSQNNGSLTFQFTSMGPAATGNDYAIDDIALNEIEIPAYDPVKTADVASLYIGDTVNYTVTLANTGDVSPLTGITFSDLLPNGLAFVPGSVFVNGVNNPTANPNSGFTA
ncbi:MAG: cell surface protein, partial [Firmicutes bacterium]|nr:cell surface protein [Bacillota bacterium]